MEVLESAILRALPRPQLVPWVLVIRPDVDEPTVRGFALAGAPDEVDPHAHFPWPPRAVLLDGVTSAEQPGELLRFLADIGLPARTPVLLAGTLGVVRALGDVAVDDFVLAPYRAEEVAERLRRLERRRPPAALWQRPPAAAPVLAFGRLEIDVAAHRVLLDRHQVLLTRLEFALLAFLAQRPHQVFSRETLLEEVWESPHTSGSRTIDIHVRRLRAKLRGHAPIETVRGVGYRFGV